MASMVSKVRSTIRRGTRNCSQLTKVTTGSPKSPSFRVYLKKNGQDPVSLFHDIPFRSEPSKRIYRMVVETGRWSQLPYEMSVEEPLNPIGIKTRDNKIRTVTNLFPLHAGLWNYGYIPQTYENPTVNDKWTGYPGDGDPVDVLELGDKVHSPGDVILVKVIGALGLIENKETDWKMLSICVDDPLASQLETISDIYRLMPGLLEVSMKWFPSVRIGQDKTLPFFAFDGKPKDPDFAEQVIANGHREWRQLFADRKEGISLLNTTLTESRDMVSSKEATLLIESNPIGGELVSISPQDANQWKFEPSFYPIR